MVQLKQRGRAPEQPDTTGMQHDLPLPGLNAATTRATRRVRMRHALSETLAATVAELAYGGRR